MVEPIGYKPVQTANRPAPVAPSARAKSAEPVASEAAPSVAADTVRAQAAEAAKAPPVDHDRVATIRAAIQNRRFPILPAEIADQLIALKLNWVPNDPA